MGKFKSEVPRSYSGFPIESESGFRNDNKDPESEQGLTEAEQEQLTNDGLEVHVENNYIDTKNSKTH